MNENTEFGFNLISSIGCRICFEEENNIEEGPKFVSLFETSAVNMLRSCGFMEVNKNDGLAEKICETCHNSLILSYNFKQKCLLSKLYWDQFIQHRNSNASKDNYQNMMKTNLFEPLKEHTEGLPETVTIIKEGIEPKNCIVESQCYVSSSDIKPMGQSSEELLRCSEFNDIFDAEADGHKKDVVSQPLSPVAVGEELSKTLDVDLPTFQYACDFCSESFIEENDLQLHLCVHTDKDPKCSACNKVFSKMQMLKRHIKIHMVSKAHICQNCGKGFSESYALKKHLQKHMGIPRKKRHICDECGQRFSEPYWLRIHMRKHTGDRPLQCSECNKSFSDPRSLQVHRLSHNKEKLYRCHICPKAFSQSFNLTKHIRIHNGEKRHSCEICGKSFTQSCTLKKHSTTHTGEKPYACEICPKRFPDKSALTRHQRVHTGEKPYSCTYCSESFASSYELTVHTWKHTGERKNICDWCGKSFTTPSHLQIHIRKHTKERPFQCGYCNQKFVDKNSIKRHLKVKHKQLNTVLERDPVGQLPVDVKKK